MNETGKSHSGLNRLSTPLAGAQFSTVPINLHSQTNRITMNTYTRNQTRFCWPGVPGTHHPGHVRAGTLGRILCGLALACAFWLTVSPASAQLPVTDGLVVWLKADAVDPGDTASQVRVVGSDVFVKQWNDQSGNGFNASNGTDNDQPVYIADGLNGRPVLRFAQDNDDDGDRLYLGDRSANFPSAATVFVIATIDNDGRYNLFGNRDNDERWVANTWTESHPGSFRTARASGSFSYGSWPQTGSHFFMLESSSAVYRMLIDGTQVGSDAANYNSGSGQNWTIGNRATSGQQLQGDIAEVILFNRILTGEEVTTVSLYLSAKYGLKVVPSQVQVAPSVILGDSVTATVSIPSGANASADVIVYLTNSSPTVVTIDGKSDPVITLNFAAGTATSQNLNVTGVAFGAARLTTGCDILLSSSTAIAVLPHSGLIGRWLTGEQDLLDKSGYLPAGTHDGIMSDGLTPTFSGDVPDGATGSSLDLIGAGGAVLIANSAASDAGYRPTFDDGVARQVSIAFWAKYDLGDWNPFISKWGEDSTGWQVRKRGNQPVGTFTLRGTSGEDDPYNGSTLINDVMWHHFVATWDGVTGVRRLYVDGKLNILVPHDVGPMGLATANYLTLGGRTAAGSSTPGNLFNGQLFDVRIYGVPLTGSDVQRLFTMNTDALVAYADTPVMDLGKSGTASVSIPATANASSAVTVYVTNTSPAVVSLAGAVGNVVTLTFPAGGATSQTLALTGLSDGQAKLDCAATGLSSASVTIEVNGPQLIGRWFDGSESLADKSGFAPAGTHDGLDVGASAVTYSADTPPSKPGKAAQFNGSAGVMINNSSKLDGGYMPTYDAAIANQFSVAFWAKGFPGEWGPFVSKRGEDEIGWQARRQGNSVNGCFTIRSTSGADDPQGAIALDDGLWHHIAAVWDGYSGTRKWYVDGVLDANINLTGDFAPLMTADNHHVVLGAREESAVSLSPAFGGWFTGSLYDVRMYNYPLSVTEVKALAFVAAITVTPAKRSLGVAETMTVNVILPEGANQSQQVVVNVLNNTPSLISLVGATANTVTLTYPVGGSLTQQVSVVGITDGKALLTATGGGFAAGSATFNVWSAPGNRLIGHWISGNQDLLDSSGFRPAGTHNGYAVGSGAASLWWSADVPTVAPAGASSLDLMGGNVAVAITNSSTRDGNYLETFDYQMANKFSITFWAKGAFSGDWNPWVSKRGENDLGYQVRRFSSSDPTHPTFTIRGTPGNDDPDPGVSVDNDTWHHYAATWDGTTGNRKLYVDGNPILDFGFDFGPMAPATGDHFVIGGRDNGSFGNFFPGLIYDVRVYSYALSSTEVGGMANPPTTLSLTLLATEIPLGRIEQLMVTLPAGATDSGPVTIHLTNNSPTVVTIVGAAGNTFDVTFPQGTLVQTVNLEAIGLGQINLAAGTTAVGTAELTTVNMVIEPMLIGHWLNGSADLADKSGFTAAGTHDGVAVGPNAAALAYSADVPAGFTGQSLNLTAGNVGVMIQNTANTDAAYQPTFDEGIAPNFTIAFWAKGFPTSWNAWVTKRGEGGVGWQLRRWGGNNFPCFTVRGLDNDDGTGSGVNVNDNPAKWHHFAGVWDQATGRRWLYVDGVLSHVNYNTLGENMSLSPDRHLALGAREWGNAGTDFEGYFSGLLFDVRIYDYPMTVGELAAVITPPPLPAKLTIQLSTGNQVRISWPTSETGYTLQQSSSLSSGWGASGLAVTVEGNENVAYAPITANPLFVRLMK